MELKQLKNLVKYVASSDTTRIHLNGINVEVCDKDATKRLFVATDGHICAVIEGVSDIEAGFYHADQIEAAFTLDKLGQDYKAMLQPDKSIKYPNWKQFVPKYDTELKSEDKNPAPLFEVITFNPDLLSDLKKGLSIPKNKGVQLVIKDNMSAVYVKCQEGDRYGVMMPMRGF